MVILRVLSILFGVLAVLALGAAPAPVEAEAMPCHEQGMQMTPSPDTQLPSKPLGTAMTCCVMCVVSPVQEPAGPSPAVVGGSTPVIAVGRDMTNLPLSPASPPPRLPASL